jgi:hypothetical protein
VSAVLERGEGGEEVTEAETMAREVAADKSGYVEYARSAFRAGWDAAMEHVKERDAPLTQMQSDGRYCRHRDDDPSHGATCYRQGL